MTDTNDRDADRVDELLLEWHEQLIGGGLDFPCAPPTESVGDSERFTYMRECLEMLERVRASDDECISSDTERTAHANGTTDISGADDAAQSSLRIGRFEIERRLGGGGQGVVVLAHDPLLRRRRCIENTSPGNNACPPTTRAVLA